MCGVFAYKGPNNHAADLTIQGLSKLEYRGYDSWGIAYATENNIEYFKTTGKISEHNNLKLQFPKTNITLAHTRWATHGGVTEKNAHPHLNSTKTIAVVHNGIIENFEEIKTELISLGYNFISETDTEVIPHLIDHLTKTLSFPEAVISATKRLHGRYAFVILNLKNNQLIAARHGSPLIIGKKQNEFFIASDIPAFLNHTHTVNYLDDNQMVVIDNEPHYFDLKTGVKLTKRDIQIDLKPEQAEKGNYPHFMIKEIMEQKETLYRTINRDSKQIIEMSEAIKKAYGTFFIGCGTAGKVCAATPYIFSKIANRHVNFAVASEFEPLKNFIQPKSLIIAISQSGETADILEAIDHAKSKKAKIGSIINVEGSSIDQKSDLKLHLKVGPEIAVASTKATTAQIALCILLAFAVNNQLDEGKKILMETASSLSDMLNPRYEDNIISLAKQIQHKESLYVIGKSVNFPMALESAIKLQEVSYIHAEGFASGELKHGPLALITEGTPVIALITNDSTQKDILGNAYEIKARGGYLVGISPTNHQIFDVWLKVPDIPITSPILNIIPIQLLAYHIGVLKNINPDRPRNLAKSVTVK